MCELHPLQHGHILSICLGPQKHVAHDLRWLWRNPVMGISCQDLLHLIIVDVIIEKVLVTTQYQCSINV